MIDTAANVPDALKLLATLSDIADNALFLNITSEYNQDFWRLTYIVAPA